MKRNGAVGRGLESERGEKRKRGAIYRVGVCCVRRKRGLQT